MFKRNEGDMDRGVRIVMGIGMIGAGLFLGGTWGLVLGAVGLIPLLTGAIGWCPLYSVFHINTCPYCKS